MAHPRKVATYDDLLALPDHVVGELVGGELHVSPRPAVPHALVASTIGMDVGSWFQRGRGGPGGWWILYEPELHLGPDVLVPDLAGWRRERMSTPPPGAAIELAPDWVCEVLSPSTVRFDRTAKLAVDARVGVPWLWFVDPIHRTLECLKLAGEARWLVHSSFTDGKAHIPPFETVEIDLDSWWPPGGT